MLTQEQRDLIGNAIRQYRTMAGQFVSDRQMKQGMLDTADALEALLAENAELRSIAEMSIEWTGGGGNTTEDAEHTDKEGIEP